MDCYLPCYPVGIMRKTDMPAQRITEEPPGKREALGTKLEKWKESLKIMVQIALAHTEMIRSSFGSK